MPWVVGGAAAIAVWLGWLFVSPTFGFPTTAPAAMFDRFLPVTGSGWLGWAVLLAGEAALVVLYVAGVTSRRLPRGLRFGLLYGAAVWLITGAVVMPLMALAAPAAAMMAEDPMRTSFMMLHLGPLAPLNALLGRLVYGALLGATSRLA